MYSNIKRGSLVVDQRMSSGGVPDIFEVKEGYLLITGQGTRQSLHDVAEYSARLYNQVVETKSKFLLVDYRQVKVRLPQSEAFNIIRNYETSRPFYGAVVAACVFGPESINFARYWQQIGRQRGFDINLFPNLMEAEQWLLNRIRESGK